MLNSKEKYADKAFQKELNNLQINCVKCNWNGKLIEYTEHYKKHQDVICEYCNCSFSSVDSLKMHLDEKTGNCPKQLINCSYNTLGCKDQYVRQYQDQHMSEGAPKHLSLVYEDINPRLSLLESQIHELTNSRHETIDDSRIISTISSENNNEMAAESPSSGTKTKSKSSSKDADASIKKAKSVDNDIASKLTIMEFSQNNLRDDLIKYIRYYEKLQKELDETKENEKKQKEQLDNLQKTLTIAQATIMNLEERLIAQEKVSYNGTLIWKITNVNDKIQEAQSGRQPSVYSPPFYTHQNGYKMCGRIYLNGDGMGRNTHVSLFFVIMRGEYDALLRWPFRQKVTFILIDQSQGENRENIIDAFRPDPNSNSFKRPTSEMNIASGIPLFCALSKLKSTDHEYLKEDCLFIKIIVDSRDLVDI